MHAVNHCHRNFARQGILVGIRGGWEFGGSIGRIREQARGAACGSFRVWTLEMRCQSRDGEFPRDTSGPDPCGTSGDPGGRGAIDDCRGPTDDRDEEAGTSVINDRRSEFKRPVPKEFGSRARTNHDSSPSPRSGAIDGRPHLWERDGAGGVPESARIRRRTFRIGRPSRRRHRSWPGRGRGPQCRDSVGEHRAVEVGQGRRELAEESLGVEVVGVRAEHQRVPPGLQLADQRRDRLVRREDVGRSRQLHFLLLQRRRGRASLDALPLEYY